jgi:hypothetical protein
VLLKLDLGLASDELDDETNFRELRGAASLALWRLVLGYLEELVGLLREQFALVEAG